MYTCVVAHEHMCGHEPMMISLRNNESLIALLLSSLSSDGLGVGIIEGRITKSVDDSEIPETSSQVVLFEDASWIAWMNSELSDSSEVRVLLTVLSRSTKVGLRGVIDNSPWPS